MDKKTNLLEAHLGSLEVSKYGLIELITDKSKGGRLVKVDGTLPKIIEAFTPIFNSISWEETSVQIKESLETQIVNKKYPEANAFHVKPLENKAALPYFDYIINYFKIR